MDRLNGPVANGRFTAGSVCSFRPEEGGLAFCNACHSQVFSFLRMTWRMLPLITTRHGKPKPSGQALGGSVLWDTLVD